MLGPVQIYAKVITKFGRMILWIKHQCRLT